MYASNFALFIFLKFQAEGSAPNLRTIVAVTSVDWIVYIDLVELRKVAEKFWKKSLYRRSSKMR